MGDDLDRAIHEDIVLVPHRPEWAMAFEREKERLLGLYPREFVQIEHFGSTAVPGMPAKPIIDMLAGVAAMSSADALLESLLSNGYTTSREFNAMLHDRKWLMRARDGRRTHHLHIVEYGGMQWRDRLRFRDALRQSPGLAQSYAERKARLAVAHRGDREAYTDAKSGFVARVLALQP
ncbi:GrpB family protein [Ramlibacter albus]|uniref:GrpB family protein n=1 Tax=Ramlibacter albus TaxID=2079448 RepID=A0A923M7C8_9BURK|nr:GrpB family protein [Ramlibacter albus]MBC5765597.1 GrpB family protein [Ramlibacter albus]